MNKKEDMIKKIKSYQVVSENFINSLVDHNEFCKVFYKKMHDFHVLHTDAKDTKILFEAFKTNLIKYITLRKDVIENDEDEIISNFVTPFLKNVMRDFLQFVMAGGEIVGKILMLRKDNLEIINFINTLYQELTNI